MGEYLRWCRTADQPSEPLPRAARQGYGFNPACIVTGGEGSGSWGAVWETRTPRACARWASFTKKYGEGIYATRGGPFVAPARRNGRWTRAALRCQRVNGGAAAGTRDQRSTSTSSAGMATALACLPWRKRCRSAQS